MPSSILFPLRSSAAWFKSPDTVEDLWRYIKVALLCYDNLNFQDGYYDLTVTENGAFELPHHAPAGVPRKLQYGLGRQASFSISREPDGEPMPLIQGTTVASYHVDFHPVLHDVGLNGVDGIRLWGNDLNDAATKAANESASKDLRTPQQLQALPVPDFERNYVVKALHWDLLLAAVTKMNVAFDWRVSSAAMLRQQRIPPGLLPDVAPIAFNTLLRFNLPDVRALSWDRVLELRESHSGVALREMLERARARVLDELPNLQTTQDVHDVVSGVIIQDLLEEVWRLQPTAGSIAFGAALNLLPVLGTAIDTTISAVDAVQAQRSWIALLQNPERP